MNSIISLVNDGDCFVARVHYMLLDGDRQRPAAGHVGACRAAMPPRQDGSLTVSQNLNFTQENAVHFAGALMLAVSGLRSKTRSACWCPASTAENWAPSRSSITRGPRLLDAANPAGAVPDARELRRGRAVIVPEISPAPLHPSRFAAGR